MLVKPVRLQCVGLETQMENTRNVYRILVGKRPQEVAT
jgi:hypothetical protein